MNKGTIQLKGLQRNFPAGMNDGGCDEFINLRYTKGAFRPIGKKEATYPLADYDKGFIHKQDTFENWIGYNDVSKKIEHYNPTSTLLIQELKTLTGELYDLRSLKNFLLATTSTGLFIWLWSDDTYKEFDIVGLSDNFDVKLERDPGNIAEPDWTDLTPDASPGGIYTDEAVQSAIDALLGFYFKKLNGHSDDGQLVGGVSYRIALKLFDGSYILHTVPRFYEVYTYDMLFEQLGFQGVPGGVRMRFGAAGIKATAQISSFGLDIESIRDIVSSIDLFFSRGEQFYEVSEETIDREFFETLGGGYPGKQIYNAYEIIGVDPGFKELHDSPAWYKVGSIDIGQIEGESTVKTGDMTLDLKGFYQNYATRRILPIDGFSHHGITGEASYVYNNRLALGNTTQFLAEPDILSLKIPQSRFSLLNALQPLVFDADIVDYIEYEYDTAYTGRAIVKIKTEDGEKTVVSTFLFGVYQDPGENVKKAVFLQGITGYFDQRATSIQLMISTDSGVTFKTLIERNLVSSIYSNYSYLPNTEFDTGEEVTPSYPLEDPRRHDVNFAGWQIAFNTGDLPVATEVPTEENTVKNNNGRQVSDVSNPLVFDPQNFQDVSTGTIIAFGSNTDPISDSQFGQYPLYNFTSVGIWASQIGLGEVYIISDVPVNGEVILSKDSKVDISFGTVYATLEGLKIISGKQVIEISETVEGLPDQYFSDNEQLQYFLNLPQTVNVQSMVDHVSFKEYLVGSKVGYSKGNDNSEIYVTNSAYDYCYMFDIKNKLWSKLSGKYNGFISNYPELFARRITTGEEATANMSVEVKSNVPCYFHTKGLSMSGSEIFKKLHRSFLRGFLNMASGKFAALYLFGSDNLIDWTFVTGNDRNSGAFNNIWITHSNKSYRYYNYVFAAELDFDTTLDSHIKYIEFQEKQKWARKLR